MARIQEVSVRINSLKELLEIVSAIRAIAAVQMQQAQRSLDAIRRYSEEVSGALAEAASLMGMSDVRVVPAECARLGLVVVCSEHGFCGGFNDKLLDAAEQAIAESGSDVRLVVVGNRGAQRAAERGRRPDFTLQMATHSGGVTAVVHRVAREFYRMFCAGELGRLEVVYSGYTDGRQTGVERSLLLPLDPLVLERNLPSIPPLVNLDAGDLFEELAGEYFFAALEKAVMESFASENAARFRTMEAAHENIDKKFDELNRLARRLRQEAVTTEILDLIGGAEAMRSR
jgi:F-type H+-transporting ATPase subunit gamma